MRCSEGFVENFGAALLARIAREAPGVRMHFQHKLEKDSGPMREGSVDLETGVVDKAIGPEVRTQALFGIATWAWSGLATRGRRSTSHLPGSRRPSARSSPSGNTYTCAPPCRFALTIGNTITIVIITLVTIRLCTPTRSF